MFSWFRRKLAWTGRVIFCDSCGQVCTSECRSMALVEQTRVHVLERVGRLA